MRSGRAAFKEAREAKAKGEEPDSWLARAAAWTMHAYEDAKADYMGRTSETHGHETHIRLDDRSDETASWQESDVWDLGDADDADNQRESGGDAESEDNPDDNDGEGTGIVLVYPETFEDLTSAAVQSQDSCASASSLRASENWLIVACARSSPTCRQLAPLMAILSYDSTFASNVGDGFKVGWVDCTPDDARSWCVERLKAKVVPTVIAIACGREKQYDLGFKGDFIPLIRKWSTDFAREANEEAAMQCSAEKPSLKA